MGDVLGGRPDDPATCDADGFVRYDLVAVSAPFMAGLDRPEAGVGTYRVALLCAEEDPVSRHRRRPVARSLEERGVRAMRIRGDGRLGSGLEVTTRVALAHPEPLQLGLDGPPAWRSIHPVPGSLGSHRRIYRKAFIENESNQPSLIACLRYRGPGGGVAT